MDWSTAAELAAAACAAVGAFLAGHRRAAARLNASPDGLEKLEAALETLKNTQTRIETKVDAAGKASVEHRRAELEEQRALRTQLEANHRSSMRLWERMFEIWAGRCGD